MDTFYWKNNKQKTNKRLTPNVQFDKMAALSRPKFCLILQLRGSPSGSESRHLAKLLGRCMKANDGEICM